MGTALFRQLSLHAEIFAGLFLQLLIYFQYVIFQFQLLTVYLLF